MKVANDSGETLVNFSTGYQAQKYPEQIKSNHSVKRKTQVGTLENGQVTKFYFEKLVKIEYALGFTISLSLILIVTASQLQYNYTSSDKQSIALFCLIVNSINTLAAIFILIMRALNLLNLDKKRKIVYQSTNFFSTKRIGWLVLQIIGLLVQPYSFFMDINIETFNSLHKYQFLFPLNDLLSIFSLSRAYIIFRGILSLTTYMNNRSNRLCKMYGSKSNYQFALKCLFKDNPLSLIIVLFCVSSFIFGYAVFLAQRNYSQVIDSQVICQPNSACTFSNALWLILMTITTVGYGDYFPQTPLGRLIIFLVAIWGTFIVSIMVVVVSNTLKMQKKQKQASLVIKKLFIRNRLKQIAGKFIGYSCLKRKAMRLNNNLEIQKWDNKVKLLKKQFSALRKSIKLIRNQMDLYDQIASNFLNMNSDIDILNQNQQNIIQFIHQNLQYKHNNINFK